MWIQEAGVQGEWVQEMGVPGGWREGRWGERAWVQEVGEKVSGAQGVWKSRGKSGASGGLRRGSAVLRGHGSRCGGPWLARAPPKAWNEALPARG